MTLLTFRSFGERSTATTQPLGWTASATNYAAGRFTNSWSWGTGGTPTMSYQIPSPAAGDTVVVGTATKFSANTTVAGEILSLLNAGSVRQLTLVSSPNTGGLGCTLQLRRGLMTGTLLAETTTKWLPNVWRYIEMKATINDTTGTVTVRVDGQVVLTFTGDTAETAALTFASHVQLTGRTDLSMSHGDVYILNTAGVAPHNDFLGDVRCEYLPVVGNGGSSQLLGSDGNSLNNWELVDEVPANAVDYVGSATVGQKDYYSIAASSATGLQTIYGMQSIGAALKSDAGSAKMKLLILQQGETFGWSSQDYILSTTLTGLSTSAIAEKWSGGPLTTSVINNMQIGAEVVTP